MASFSQFGCEHTRLQCKHNVQCVLQCVCCTHTRAQCWSERHVYVCACTPAAAWQLAAAATGAAVRLSWAQEVPHSAAARLHTHLDVSAVSISLQCMLPSLSIGSVHFSNRHPNMVCRQSGAEAQPATKACLGPSCRQLQAVVTSLGWLSCPTHHQSIGRRAAAAAARWLAHPLVLHKPLYFSILPCICWSFASSLLAPLTAQLLLQCCNGLGYVCSVFGAQQSTP